MSTAILDTDTLSEVLKRRDPTVLTHARAYLGQHQQFAFSAITRYEVRRGYLSRRAAARLQRFEVFCQHSTVYPITDDVLDRAALLWADARARGLPDNDADLIIAATALVQGRTLVTGNTAHFSWIPGLTLEDWRQP
jgi:tRNA(fMet)-specific endonuclease VapC